MILKKKMIIPQIRVRLINPHPINSNNKIKNNKRNVVLIASINMHLDKEFQ